MVHPARFDSGAFDERARECAHAVLVIGLHQTANLLSFIGLASRRGFPNRHQCVFAFTRKIHRIRKCLRAVYLEVRW